MVLPLYAYDLIDQLDSQYPERCPDIKDTEREIWMSAGRREVVRSLVLIKKQEEDEQEEEGNIFNKDED